MYTSTLILSIYLLCILSSKYTVQLDNKASPTLFQSPFFLGNLINNLNLLIL